MKPRIANSSSTLKRRAIGDRVVGRKSRSWILRSLEAQSKASIEANITFCYGVNHDILSRIIKV